jgi:hypothetical protein
MDEPRSDPEFDNRERKPYRVSVPVWASVVIAVVMLVVSAVALSPKKPTPIK